MPTKSWPPRLLRTLLSGLFVASAPVALSAQPDAVICVDHRARKAFLNTEDPLLGCPAAMTEKDLVETGDEVRVDTGRQLGVRIINTNTALFDLDVTEERIAAKDKEILQSFLKALGPYLVDVLKAEALPWTDARLWSAEEDRLREALEDLDKVLDRLRRVEAERILGFPAVVADPGVGGRSLLETLVKLAAVEGTPNPREPWPKSDPCLPRWPDLRLSALSSEGAGSLFGVYRGIIDALAKVRSSRPQRTPDVPAGPSPLIEAARQALAEQSAAMDSAYALEALVRQAVNASDQWCWEGPEIRSSRAHKVTITLSLLDRLAAQRLAELKPYDLALEVQPYWLLRPAIGLSLLYSKKSVFPDTFVAKELPDKTFRPAATGQQDARLAYGLTLGVTWRSLERRLKGGWAVWIPELTLNPDDKSRAFGVGAGISWKVVKLGVGALWTKHTVLDGQVVDVTVLASAGDLKTRSTYASPKFYVSISVIGWQPFVSE